MFIGFGCVKHKSHQEIEETVLLGVAIWITFINKGCVKEEWENLRFFIEANEERIMKGGGTGVSEYLTAGQSFVVSPFSEHP